MPVFCSPGRLTILVVLVLGSAVVDLEAVGADDPDSAPGRRMYREGIRPSGEPLTAIVTGDVPFLGTQFSCQSCHGRSGMGAAEGSYIVPAIAGQFLFAPSPQPARPAYDRESLARALREGMDPTGRPLDRLMPRYRLTDDEVADLAVYLAELSAGNSPGVDDTVIRFATVVSADVDPEQRQAVLAVLRTYVGEKNRQTRLESQRFDRGSTPASRLPTLFREWVLDEWTLTGPSEGWSEQLENRYRSAPVFAVLGGLVAGSWAPIGRFCERREVPCLFPLTDQPDAAPDDFYTLYFSRGLELEADLIASHLAAHPVHTVVQVSCGAAPERASATLHSALARQGVAVKDLELSCNRLLPMGNLAARMAENPDAAAVLWVWREQLGDQPTIIPALRVYYSSTMLGPESDGALLTATGQAFMVHPFRLPGESDAALRRFTLWARTRGIEMSYPRLQAKTFFACLATNDAVSHLGRYFVRDYVLDMLDHAQSLVAYLPIHARPTLGPGQRFLTKGGYVIPLLYGQLETKDALWILP